MQFPSDSADSLLGRTLCQEGLLIRFSPGTIFGNTNHHFGVVASSYSDSGEVALIVGTTSKIQTLTRFCSIRNLPPETVVVIGAGTHPNFGKQTAFNCNQPEIVSRNTLIGWYQNGLIEIPKHDHIINPALLVEIRAGVYVSDLVESKFKNLLFP